MANKRDIKKFLKNTCGALASEIILARAAFPQVSRKDVHDIVADIARLQADALGKVSISFDKTARDFASANEYRKARAAYFAKAYAKLLENFDNTVAEIVKKMNAALPEEVREQIKTAAAE